MLQSTLYHIGFIVLAIANAGWSSCPLSSYESREEYQYNGIRLICDYQNGRLAARFQRNGYETVSIDYHSNGMPREYRLRSQNMGGGLYLENKKYNPSGMLIEHYLISGNSGFDCTYAGEYRLKCISYENGVDYYLSVEYASQYEGN